MSFVVQVFEILIVRCRNSKNTFSSAGTSVRRAIRGDAAIQPLEAQLQKTFKQKLAQRGLKGKVRANQSGCLDQCEHGPTVVVYPDAIWYGHVTEADVDEIIESHIVGGHPVERLAPGRLLPEHRNLRASQAALVRSIARYLCGLNLSAKPRAILYFS